MKISRLSYAKKENLKIFGSFAVAITGDDAVIRIAFGIFAIYWTSELSE